MTEIESTNYKAAAMIRSLLDDCQEMQSEEVPTEYQKDILYRYNWNVGYDLRVVSWEEFRQEAENVIAELVPEDLFLRRIDY